MVVRILRIVVAGLLLIPATLAGDVLKTTDGRRIAGSVRFADGSVYVSSEQGPARLKIEQIASLYRDLSGSDQPGEVATGIVPTHGLMVEYFADEQLEEFRSVGFMRTHKSDATFHWNKSEPDMYNGQTFAARLTGWITAKQTGSYRFLHHGFDDAEIAGRPLEKNAMSAAVHLQAGERIPVRLVMNHFDAGKTSSGVLHWSINDQPRHPIPAQWLSPPDQFTERLLSFHHERLRGDPGGLKGEYFVTQEMNDRDRRLVRLDPVVAQRWSRSTHIHPDFEEGFATRWTGKLKARRTGDAGFRVSPRTRLWVDGQKLIDAWPGGADADKERVARMDLEESRVYDIRIEFLSLTKGSDSVRLHWGQEGNPKAISSQYLYPPADMPRVRIVLPLEMSQINATRGVTILLATMPGRGSIRKAEIIDDQNDQVLGESTQPPFAVTIHPERGGIITVRARVTDAAGQVALSDPITFAVHQAASRALVGDWTISRVGYARMPEVNLEEDGRLTLTSQHGQLSQKSSVPLITRPLGNDEQLVARLVELKSDDPDAGPMAGLIVRRGLGSEDPFIALVASQKEGWILALSEQEEQSRFLPVALPPPPVWLRIARSGRTASAEYSVDGEDWIRTGAIALGDEDTLLAGVTAFSLKDRTATTAVFDNITLHSGPMLYLAAKPGIQLTSGSIIYGKVTVSGSSFTVRPADGPQQTFPAAQVARVLYGPLMRNTVDKLPRGWRGAVVNGDHLEGDITDLSGDGATVRSIIFGIQRLTAANRLDAAIINDVAIDPNAVIVHHRGGCVLAKDLRLEQDKLVVTDPVLGRMTLPIDQIASIERPG